MSTFSFKHTLRPTTKLHYWLENTNWISTNWRLCIMPWKASSHNLLHQHVHFADLYASAYARFRAKLTSQKPMNQRMICIHLHRPLRALCSCFLTDILLLLRGLSHHYSDSFGNCQIGCAKWPRTVFFVYQASKRDAIWIEFILSIEIISTVIAIKAWKPFKIFFNIRWWFAGDVKRTYGSRWLRFEARTDGSSI